MVRRGNSLTFQSVISAVVVVQLLANRLCGVVVLENNLAATLFVDLIKPRHPAGVCVEEHLRGVVNVVSLYLFEVSHSRR